MKDFNFKPDIKIIFKGIVLLHLADLLFFCFNFVFVYTDSDQTNLWLAGTDMSRGLFYEPGFYGQSYNSMIEALIALPMILAGAFTPFALSLSTVLLSYSVIWLFTWYFYQRKNFNIAILCLALPILLPTEFQVMTSISRGFVPGIVFTLYGVYCLLTYKSNLKLFLTGSLIAIGIVFNPNCSIILVPFAVYYFLNPIFLKRNELFLIFIGSLPALFYKTFCFWFYSTYPNYNLHVFPNPFAFSIKSWIYSASEIYYLFKGLFPVVNNLGCLSIILLLVLVILILKKSNKVYEKLSAVSGFLFILFCFGVNKVTDGTGSPFFPYSRMFLGIPVLYIFYFSILQKYTLSKIPLYVSALFVTGIFIFKTLSLPDRIQYIVKHNTGAVSVSTISDVCESCDSIKKIMVETNTDILVLGSKRDQVTYGCPALIKNLRTILPGYERRLWVYEKEMFIPRKKFLFYFEGPISDSNFVGLAKNYYAVSLPNPMTLENWFKMKNYNLRRYIK